MKITKMFLISAVVAFALFGFAACGDSEDVEETAAPETTAAVEEETAAPTFNAGEYGYAGTDPVEAEVYEYMADEVSEQYGIDDDTVISIPVVSIVNRVDNADGSVDIYGDFQVYNYTVEGDTLKCISGGDHPGKMHIVKDDDGDEYEVASFEQVGDGSEFEPTAKKIFGDKYEDFVKVQSDDKGMEKLRAEAIAVYVKTMGLKVTKYQDEGWDPVDIPL